MDVLGVDAAVAQKAACKAEHLLGPVIISRMRDFTNLTKKKAGRGRNPARIAKVKASKKVRYGNHNHKAIVGNCGRTNRQHNKNRRRTGYESPADYAGAFAQNAGNGGA